jgi:hypothetical protein
VRCHPMFGLMLSGGSRAEQVTAALRSVRTFKAANPALICRSRRGAPPRYSRLSKFYRAWIGDPVDELDPTTLSRLDGALRAALDL